MKTVASIILPVLILFTMQLAAEEYQLGPDSQRHAGVAHGTLKQYKWTSKIFPGTVRDYWVYVPAQYKPDKPACVMVFQDGAAVVKEDGDWRIPIVFDNLIARGQMPVTIGIFITPGVLPGRDEKVQNRYNRSFEYDGLGDRYAQFLLEEILPRSGNTTSSRAIQMIVRSQASVQVESAPSRRPGIGQTPFAAC